MDMQGLSSVGHVLRALPPLSGIGRLNIATPVNGLVTYPLSLPG